MWGEFPRIIRCAASRPNLSLKVISVVDLTSNYFEIFSLPVDYQIDRSALDSAYRALQQAVHPDRYANGSDSEKRRAVQMAALINQAYVSLKSPLQRAQYLLEMQGLDGQQHSHITSDVTFLMQQIELRERLAEAPEHCDPFAELDDLRAEAAATLQQLQADFQRHYSAQHFDAAFDTVVKMQFFTKLAEEIDQLEQDLEE